MKGTLHKTENGWEVINIQATLNGPLLQSLPLLPDDAAGLFIQDTDSKNEGKEVDFEIFDNRQRCNCACHRDPNITHFVACCNDGYKTDNLGHVNYYAKLVDEWPHYQTRADQLREQVWEEIIREFYRDAQKVPIGAPPLMIECWLAENYNPPTKKQN